MWTYIERFLDWIRSLFWKQEMEICLVGLTEAGKTTLINIMAGGNFHEDMIPTIGFNMRKISKGAVTMKIWDIGGQDRYRPMWERYCRGVDVIVYVVDSADRKRLPEATNELQTLLARPQLDNIPVLVLANKKDLGTAMDASEVIDAMNLKEFHGREICCYSISCKDKYNIGITMEWLLQHKNKAHVS